MPSRCIEPENGKVYTCIIGHWSEKVTKTHEVRLIKVNEDDVDWRFEDDNSELSYDWSVKSFR